MSPLDPEIPPSGEEIHLPGPSVLPILSALGITLALVGITTFIEFTVAGVLLTLGCAAGLAILPWTSLAALLRAAAEIVGAQP